MTTADEALAKVECWCLLRASSSQTNVEHYRNGDQAQYERWIGHAASERSLAEAIADLRDHLRSEAQP